MNMSQEIFIKKKLETIGKQMQTVFRRLLKRERLTACVTSNPNEQAYVSKRLHLLFKDVLLTHPHFATPIPQIQATTSEIEPVVYEAKKDFYIIPGNANFVVESFIAPHFSHPDSVKLQVASKVISSADLKDASQTLQ